MNLILPPASRAQAAAPAAPGGLDLDGLITVLLRRIWLILAMPILAGLIGFGAMHLVSPRYTSQTQLLIEPRRAGSIGAEAEFAMTMVDHAKVASVLSILESTALLQRVVREQSLLDYPEFAASRPGLLHRLAMLANIPPPADPISGNAALVEQRAIERLRAAVKVVRVGTTYVLRVDATAGSPELARRISLGVAEAYLTDQLESKLDAARRASVWTSRRLGELREELLRSEQEVERIRREYNLIEVDRGTNSVVGRQAITELNQQLLQAEAELRERSARLEQLDRIQRGALGLDTLSDVMGSTVVASLRAQQAEVARRVAELGQRLGPRHPDYSRAEEERLAIDRQIGAEIRRIAQHVRNEYQVALRRRDELNLQLARVTDSTGGAVSAEGVVRLREAERVAQVNRQVYDRLLTQAEEMEQQQTRQQAEGRVISVASLPDRPSSPTLILFVLLPGFAGGILGVGLAFALSALDRTYATSRQLERGTGLPVLATVPLVGPADLKTPQGAASIVEYARDRQLSQFAEALRSIRTGLQMSRVDSPPRVIHVTSSMPNEGKSTLAAALAVATANAGLRTLLVDADFRRPSVATLFGLKGSTGAVDVLAGTADLEDVLIPYGETALTLLPAGSITRSPPDLIGSERFRNLIAGLSKRFDMIFIDSPPLLAVSDARLTASVSDATVMVVEWRRTPKDIVEQAVGILSQNDTPLAGLVLNKADFRKMGRYGYGYGYGYRYRGYGKYYRAAAKYYQR